MHFKIEAKGEGAEIGSPSSGMPRRHRDKARRGMADTTSNPSASRKSSVRCPDPCVRRDDGESPGKTGRHAAEGAPPRKPRHAESHRGQASHVGCREAREAEVPLRRNGSVRPRSSGSGSMICWRMPLLSGGHATSGPTWRKPVTRTPMRRSQYGRGVTRKG